MRSLNIKMSLLFEDMRCAWAKLEHNVKHKQSHRDNLIHDPNTMKSSHNGTISTILCVNF